MTRSPPTDRGLRQVNTPRRERQSTGPSEPTDPLVRRRPMEVRMRKLLTRRSGSSRPCRRRDPRARRADPGTARARVGQCPGGLTQAVSPRRALMNDRTCRTPRLPRLAFPPVDCVPAAARIRRVRSQELSRPSPSSCTPSGPCIVGSRASSAAPLQAQNGLTRAGRAFPACIGPRRDQVPSFPTPAATANAHPAHRDDREQNREAGGAGIGRMPCHAADRRHGPRHQSRRRHAPALERGPHHQLRR